MGLDHSGWKWFLLSKTMSSSKSYTLAKLVGIFKAPESEVLKKVKVVSGMGSLTLIEKGKTITMDGGLRSF